MKLMELFSVLVLTLTAVGCSNQSLEKKISETKAKAPISNTDKGRTKARPEVKYCDSVPNIKPLEVQIVSQIEGGNPKPPDQKPKYAKLGEKVNLFAVLKAKANKKTVYFTQANSLKIKGRKIPKKQIKKWDFPCQPLFKWLKVEPYHNNYRYVSSKNPIDYVESSFAEGWKVKADVHPNDLGDQFPDIESGLGVMRYKVSAKLNGKKLATPGKNSLHAGGLSKKVHRVSFRPDTGSFTDHLFELFNLPYSWGSSPYQVDGQVAVDCADLPIYALRRAGHKIKYTWSKGILNDRKHFQKLPLDAKIKPGDLLYYNRHIMVMYKDNGSGVLDGGDELIHTLFHEPVKVKLGEVGFPQAILRFKK